jgi:hypothetical protein
MKYTLIQYNLAESQYAADMEVVDSANKEILQLHQWVWARDHEIERLNDEIIKLEEQLIVMNAQPMEIKKELLSLKEFDDYTYHITDIEKVLAKYIKEETR